MDRHDNRNWSTDFDRERFGRGEYRGQGNTEGRDRGFGREHDEEGYGRYAMGGRDYSTSGRYFAEEDRYARGRPYGGMSRYSDEERRYNVAGYGGGRTQSDFYMGAPDPENSRMSSDFYAGDTRTQREGEGGEYGYGPSDDYQRGGYGRYDRETGASNYRRQERGGWQTQQGNRSGYDRPDRERNRGHGDSSREERFIDEDYADDYRHRRRGLGASMDVWNEYDGWQPRGGPHVGRGPKGYERSSDRIKEEICERLTHHGHIDASDVEITVNNGEVTLTGTVDSRVSKRLAEDIAESVSGVRDVHNQLRISRTGTDRGEQGTSERENGQTSERSSKRTAQQP